MPQKHYLLHTANNMSLRRDSLKAALHKPTQWATVLAQPGSPSRRL